MTLTVSVFWQDIRDGQRNDCCYCPVALALHRATGTRWSVGGIGMFDAWEREGLRRGPACLPREVTLWIHNYDRGKPCKPITFKLEV